MIARANPGGLAPPIGMYSHLSFVPHDSRLLFISGQVGIRPDGTMADGIEGQTVEALANIERLLAAAGASPRDLVRLLTFVAGRDRLDGYGAARASVYGTWFPDGAYPGHSLLVAEALARDDVLVEIEGWAALPAP